MQIVSQLLDWDSDDQTAWRAFLKTRSGNRLIPKLLEGAPALLPGGEINALLIRSGEFRGWQEAIRDLLSLTEGTPLQKPPADSYPSLDDDSAWPKELGGNYNA
jgi:hypothetical protein